MICVELANVTDKGTIYKHVKNLKGKTNSKGKSYSVRDDLPEEAQEEDKRYRQMIALHKKNTTATNIKLSVKNRKLMINNSQYRKRAPAPSDAELLQMSDSEREIVQEKSLMQSKDHNEKGNKFMAYLCETDNTEEVRSVYKHLRIKHTSATSITMAHNITGDMPDLRDYDDNGETGMGSRMLEQMINS